MSRPLTFPAKVSFDVTEDDMSALDGLADDGEVAEGRLVVENGRVTIVDVPGQEEEELPGGVRVVDGPGPGRPEPDYAAMNPGIRRTVRFLRDHGFDTVDSGDGVTHDHACDRDYPYVGIRVDPPEALVDECRGLVELLAIHGVSVAEMEMDPGKPWIQGSFDPVSGVAIIELGGVKDSDLFRAS